MANRNAKKINQKRIKQILLSVAEKQFGFKHVKEERVLTTM